MPAVWLVSAVAVFAGRTPVWALLAGVLLFPLVPLGWLRLSDRRRNARGVNGHRLRFEDRLSWRTLVVNVFFVLLLLLLWPQGTFLALAIRGDWMLDGHSGRGVEVVRSTLVAIAERSEWAYDARVDNPYARDERPTNPCEKRKSLQVFFGTDPPGHGPPEGTRFSIYDMFSGGTSCAGVFETGFSHSDVFEQGDDDLPTLNERADAFLRFQVPSAHMSPPSPTAAEVEAERVAVRAAHERAVVEAWDRLAMLAEEFSSKHPQHISAFKYLGDTYIGYANALKSAGATGESVNAKRRSAADALDRGCHVFVQREEERQAKAALCDELASLLRQLGDRSGSLKASKDSEIALAGGPRALRTEEKNVDLSEPPKWPLTDLPDPIVVAVPGDADASIETAGAYLAERIQGDPFRLVKALHDYVVLRIEYDHAALLLTEIPDTAAEAESVWINRKGVCAGYANVFVALSEAAGVDAVYLTGEVRDEEGGIAPHSHAWNAVLVADRWYLVDTTWDDAGNDYSALYLFSPARVFGLDHFPDDPGWQLRFTPISRTAFVRQPTVGPRFAANGLSLVSPKAPQIDAGTEFRLTVGNPRGVFLMAQMRQGSEKLACTVSGGSDVHCTFPRGGSWRVVLFAGAEEHGSYQYVGDVNVNAKP